MSPPPNSCGAGLGPHSVGNLHDQDPTLHFQDEDFSWNDENWQSIRNQAMPHCGAWSTNFGHTVHQRLAQTVSRAPRATFPSFLLRPLAVWPQDTSSPTRDREREREREWGPENHGVTVEEDLRVRVDTDDLRRPEQGSARERRRESSRGRAAHASALGEKRKRCCALGGRREKRCCRE